jgi:large subunit ribosomal protein L1
MEEVMRAKPNSSKGRYVQKAVVSTTMGPGIAIDPNLVREASAN